MRRSAALGADVVVVLVFVLIGRHTHDHGFSLAGTASTMWPFACGLGLGWLVLAARHRSGTGGVDGAVLTVVTVAAGMVLRVVAGQGMAAAFVIVALAFLGAGLAGWRVVAARIRRHRAVSV